MSSFAEEKKIQSVIIYHPSKIVGGSEILFARCCAILKDLHGLDVTIVDYPGGALTKLLSERADEFCFTTVLPSTAVELRDSVFLVSARNIIQFYSAVPDSLKDHQIRTVFWLLHPAELYAQLGIGYDKIKRLLGYNVLRLAVRFNPGAHKFKKIISSLTQDGSLKYMDSSVLAESQWVLEQKLMCASVLHLPTGLNNSSPITQPRLDIKNLVLISRLDSFKVPGIRKLLDDLAAMYDKKLWRGSLTIIGYGGALEELVCKAETLPYEVSFVGHVPAEDLREALKQGNFSVLFGMGMSLLEGASIGMPCIVLPTSDSLIDDDRCYATLDPRIDSLGEYYYFPCHRFARFELSELLSDIFTYWDNYQTLSLKFFSNYYDGEKTGRGLYEAVTKSRSRSFSGMSRTLKIIAKLRALRA